MEALSDTLLREIEVFLDQHEMSATAFGLAALNDGHFVRDLRRGKDVRLSTAEKIRRFIVEHSPKRPKPRGSHAAHAA